MKEIKFEELNLKFQNSELLTIDNLGERFNMSISVSDGKNDIDTAIIMITLNPIIDQQTTAPKFSHVNFSFVFFSSDIVIFSRIF